MITLLAGCGSAGNKPQHFGRSRAALALRERFTETASYSHVIWLWMENHSYEQIVGSSSAPYLNSLARACGLATNYHNITHPSLPNYIAATSGLGSRELLQSFAGDCDPSATCSTGHEHLRPGPWLARLRGVDARRLQSARTPGTMPFDTTRPRTYSSLVECPQRDVPLTRLSSDLSTNSLPAYSFITPNLCHDTHDCPVSDRRPMAGRRGASDPEQPRLPRGPHRALHRLGRGRRGATNDCATNESDVGCHVATVIVSPSTPAGKRSGQLFNHYSLLRTTEDLLGLSPLGRGAGAASMTKPFGLGT